MNIIIKDILTVLQDEVKTCSVYVSDGKIASVSSAPQGFTADKTIYGAGKMLIPGLVNAHTHAGMTVFRNCADDLLFNDWLFNKIMPMEDKMNGDDVYWCVMLSIMEMLRSGTTAYIDMYYFTDDCIRALLDTGIRCAYSRGITGDVSVAEKKLREVFDEIERHKGHEKISFMIAPHAPYTCDEGFQREVAVEARRNNLPINTHISESLAEIETIRERYGCTPVGLLEKTGLLSDTTVAAHCVQVTDGDIDILSKRGVTVATNPVSNLKLANGIAPIPKMIAAGVKVALGTDSAASNNSLNMFRDLSMLTLVHKGVNHDELAITAKQGFEIATKGGARAMGYKNLGEIKPGNLADLVILNLDNPNMQPVNDPIAALAYSANGSEVETVIVGGEVLMENREFVTIDSKQVYYEVAKVRDRIVGN